MEWTLTVSQGAGSGGWGGWPALLRLEFGSGHPPQRGFAVPPPCHVPGHEQKPLPAPCLPPSQADWTHILSPARWGLESQWPGVDPGSAVRGGCVCRGEGGGIGTEGSSRAGNWVRAGFLGEGPVVTHLVLAQWLFTPRDWGAAESQARQLLEFRELCVWIRGEISLLSLVSPRRIAEQRGGTGHQHVLRPLGHLASHSPHHSSGLARLDLWRTLGASQSGCLPRWAFSLLWVLRGAGLAVVQLSSGWARGQASRAWCPHGGAGRTGPWWGPEG